MAPNHESLKTEAVIEALGKRAEEIRTWNEGLEGSVRTSLLRSSDERFGIFEAFCTGFSGLASRFRFVLEEEEGGDMPALLIGESLRMHMIPLENELAPFLEILSLMDGGSQDRGGHLEEALKDVGMPCEVKIYVSEHCPHCAGVVRRIAPLAFANPLIQVTLIDALLFPELAAGHDIRSVPTLICDERFRWTGPVSPEEVLEVILQRDPRDLSAQVLNRMVVEGEAVLLAEMMLKSGCLYPAFLDVLTDPLLSVRLGAMVAAEEIGERDQSLGRTILEGLWARLDSMSDSVKGDMLYLFGELGSGEWIPRLRGLLDKGIEGELREAAEEAIESLDA